MGVNIIIPLGITLSLTSLLALLFAFLAWRKSRMVPKFLVELQVQLDGRLTQLLAKTDEAGKLIGRAAEHGEQLAREHQGRILEREHQIRVIDAEERQRRE